MAKVDEIVGMIEGMTVLELSELSKTLQDKFGVSAAVPMAAGGGGAAAAPVVEEKTEFNVVFTSSGDKKIQVIKVVRELTGLGLAEAKALLDGVPKTVKEGIPREEAESIKNKLADAGGSVEIK